MTKTPPHDGTELTYADRLQLDYERLLKQNRALHAKLDNMARTRHYGTKCTVFIHDDVNAWLKNTNESHDIPVSFLVNAIIRNHMWLDVDTGEMRNDLSGLMWQPNEREY